MKQLEQKKHKYWFWLSLSALATFFILLRWNSINIPLIRDEGEYAYSAWLLSQNILPYTNSFLQKPPMVIYTYLIGYLIDSHSYEVFRLLAYFFDVAVACLLGIIARKEFGKGAGWVTVWLFTPMVLLPGIDQFTANTEKFMLLPLVGVLALYNWKQGEANIWHWFFAGVCSALAVLYKPTIIPILLFIFVVWVIEARQANAKLLLNVLGYLGGGLVASLLGLSYFLIKDGGISLWECVVVFNRYYAVFSLSGFIEHAQIFLSKWWILFLLLAWFIYKRPPRWWFYLGLFIISYFCTYGSGFGQYYVVIIPFWVLICAASVNLIVDKISNMVTMKPELIKVVLTAVILLAVCVPSLNSVTMSPEKYEQNTFAGLPFSLPIQIATRITAFTKPDDYVYIAGSEPQVYFYAKRRSSSRFVIAYPLMMDTPLAEQYQIQAKENLLAHPPKVIVLATSNTSWLRNRKSPNVFLPFLNQLLVEKYELVGGYIKNNKEVIWQEPLNKAQIPLCSFLVFVEK